MRRRRRRRIVLLEKGTEFIEKISNVSFASMVTEVNGNISLEEFDGSDGPWFFKKKLSIFSCILNYDFHARADGQKRMCSWAKFPLRLIHPSSPTHTILTFSPPLFIGWQAICIKASITNSDQSKLVNCIKMKLHFSH